jgi:hypothetical protein
VEGVYPWDATCGGSLSMGRDMWREPIHGTRRVEGVYPWDATCGGSLSMGCVTQYVQGLVLPLSLMRRLVPHNQHHYAHAVNVLKFLIS